MREQLPEAELTGTGFTVAAGLTTPTRHTLAPYYQRRHSSHSWADTYKSNITSYCLSNEC